MEIEMNGRNEKNKGVIVDSTRPSQLKISKLIKKVIGIATLKKERQ